MSTSVIDVARSEGSEQLADAEAILRGIAFASLDAKTYIVGRIDTLLDQLAAQADDAAAPSEKILAWLAAQLHNLSEACQHFGRMKPAPRQLHSLYGMTCGMTVARRLIDAAAPLLSARGLARIDVATALFSAQPTSRALGLALGDIQLSEGDHSGALETARGLLQQQAMCQDAQRLMYDALRRSSAAVRSKAEAEISLADLGDRFCSRPFTTLVTGDRGESFLCDCPAYVPFSIGNVIDAPDAEAVWNSAEAQEIRRSVLDGDFSYCSRTLCGVLKAGKLPLKSEIVDPALRDVIDNRRTIVSSGPLAVQLSHDPSCNLMCPSCRTDMINLKGSEQERYDAARDRVVFPMIENAAPGMTVWISTGGEPFSSKHYRSLLSGLDATVHSDKNVVILTNAQLLNERQWREFPNLWPLVRAIYVSCDAAAGETYEHVRRPGRWDRLVANLEFLAEQKRKGEFDVLGLFFVVQKANFREMPAFVELANRLEADLIWFQRVVNFGAYSSTTFKDIDVADESNPLHEEFREIAGRPVFQDPRIKLFSDFLSDMAIEPDDASRGAVAWTPIRGSA